MSNAKESAFPHEYNIYEDRDTVRVVDHGLTKREYFAAMAMQGMMCNERTGTHEEFAYLSVKMADALLKQLEA